MKEKKVLQSKDVGRILEPSDHSPIPAPRGPQAGSTVGIVDELAALLKAGEAAELVAMIKERRKRDAPAIYLRCDRAVCSFIGAFRPTAVGGPCPRCNWRAARWLGHLQVMSPEAIKAHLIEEGDRELEARRRILAAGLHGRNEERAKAGLPPMTLADYERENNERFQRRVADEERLQKSLAKNPFRPSEKS